jgi:hypothetical protein
MIPASSLVLARVGESGKVRGITPCHAHPATFGIHLSGPPLNVSLVPEHLCITRHLTVHDPATPSHGIGQNARAQSMPGRASTRAHRALAAPVRRALDRRRPPPASLPLHEHLLPALYTLDKRPGLPLLRRRRPPHFTAARRATDIGCARAILSRFGRASYTSSIARTPASRSRPRLALSLATGAAPWPFLLSTPRPPLDPINRGDRLLHSSHHPLPSPH